MRRTSARLTQLRAHLYRTNWRDKQAELAYWTLVLAQKDRPPSVTLSVVDAVLKEYYTPDLLGVALEMNASLRFLGAKLSKTLYVHPVEECPTDRLYCVSPLEVSMARFVDDDPPIKTHAANQAYRDNYDRIFGEEKPDEAAPAKDEDAIEARFRLWGWRCNTCDKIVYDPENHQYHAIIKISDEDDKPSE